MYNICKEVSAMCIKKFYHKFELPILIIADIILFAIAVKLDCLWITMPYF